MSMQAPKSCDTWVGVTHARLPVAAAFDWAVLPRCGAVVLFSGTARDHTAGRDVPAPVEQLEYETYDGRVEPRLAEVADEARRRWPVLGRVALLHRLGAVAVGESSVVVVVSAPHRPEAFAGGRFCIDTIKATVPIWKREVWAGGHAWAADAHDLVDAAPADVSAVDVTAVDVAPVEHPRAPANVLE